MDLGYKGTNLRPVADRGTSKVFGMRPRHSACELDLEVISGKSAVGESDAHLPTSIREGPKHLEVESISRGYGHGAFKQYLAATARM